MTPTGPFVQVSRLGNPLVNEVVIPASLKDAFNALAPENDASVTPAVNKVLNPELPYLLNADLRARRSRRPRARTCSRSSSPASTGLNRPARRRRPPSEVLRLNTSDPGHRGARTGSACSPVTTRASRTAVASPTTSSTSPSRRWPVRSRSTTTAPRPTSPSSRRSPPATGWTRTTSPSRTRSRTSRCRTRARRSGPCVEVPGPDRHGARPDHHGGGTAAAAPGRPRRPAPCAAGGTGPPAPPPAAGSRAGLASTGDRPVLGRPRASMGVAVLALAAGGTPPWPADVAWPARPDGPR